MIKHIQAHVDRCSLCQREKMQADKYQLQTTEIPKMHLLKCPLTACWNAYFTYGNKNTLVMVDYLTSWPMVKAIPDKEDTTVANAIFEKLLLEHGVQKSLYLIMGKNSQMTLWSMLASQGFGMEQHFTSPYTPKSNGKTDNFIKLLKASIRKLCQEYKASWDQVLDQILFSYRCCPHSCTGEAPYTLVCNGDSPIPIHKLINVVEPYMSRNTLGKRIEQSRVSLSIASKC